MKRVSVDDLQRGDFVIVRWRDASDIRGFMEEFGETCWMKDWGFYLGVVGRHPMLVLSKDIVEGKKAWGVSRIPVELIGEVWLVLPCVDTVELVPELSFQGRRIKLRRYDRDDFREVELRA